MSLRASSTLAVVIVALSSLPVVADLNIGIVPSVPTTSMPVEIVPWRGFSDTGYNVVDTPWSRTGDRFDVDWYVKDLHGTPGLSFLQIVTSYSGLAEVGLLAEGMYQVDATLHMSTYPFFNIFQPIEYATTSFEVIPEPAALLLFLPAVLITRRRARTRAGG